MTPWCEPVTLISSSLRLSTVTTAMPRSFALEIMRPSAESLEPRETKSLSMALPARMASFTALRPSIRSFLRSSSISRLRIAHSDTDTTIPQPEANLKLKMMEFVKFSRRALPEPERA